MLPEGTRLGAYTLGAIVHAGEVATVFRARHSVLLSDHALKLLTDVSEPVVARTLLETARLQAATNHPNVLRCTDAGYHQKEHPWLVTDWMGGGTLADRLDVTGAIPAATALRVFRGIVRGVAALHERHIVHRDLKPANVMFLDRRTWVPKIADLALAKVRTTGGASSPTLSQTFRMIGTPEYMAPEQADNVADVDERADLYSLGVVLYEMLTNEVPYDSPDWWRILAASRKGEYTPLRARRPDLSPAWEDVVAELLRPRREDRLPDCGALLARLDLLG